MGDANIPVVIGTPMVGRGGIVVNAVASAATG
jgi:hypothetical protein